MWHIISFFTLISFGAHREAGNIISFRNYDPQTKTIKKGGLREVQDTVEKEVEGVAQKIIEEDNARRVQDLVRRR
jgi:coiled-coil domain-containing protein 12